jgi:streptogramin lyase
VNPSTNRIEGHTKLGAVVFRLVVVEGVEGAVWVTATGNRMTGPLELLRIDAATKRVVARIELDVPAASFFPDTPLAVSEAGALWVLDPRNGTVFRVDTASNEVVAQVHLGSGTQTALAAGEGGVWVGDDLENVVYRIDPQRAEVVTEIPIANGASELAVGDGSVWALNNVRGTLTRIEPITNQARETISVGGSPTGLAVGEGVVWITDRGAGLVYRVNVATRDVISIRVGGAPEGIAVGEDVVWVAVGRS